MTIDKAFSLIHKKGTASKKSFQTLEMVGECDFGNNMSVANQGGTLCRGACGACSACSACRA